MEVEKLQPQNFHFVSDEITELKVPSYHSVNDSEVLLMRYHKSNCEKKNLSLNN